MSNEAKVTDLPDDNGLLSVDDLVLEIGRMHVEKMSVDKKMKLVIARQQPPKPLPELELVMKSNEQYKDNNRKLTDGLAELRATNTKLTKEHIELKEKYEALLIEVELKDKQLAKLPAKKTTRKPRVKVSKPKEIKE